MEVIETNKLADQSTMESRPQIDSEEVNAYVASLFEALREKSHQAENHVKTEWIPLIKQWIQDVKDMMDPNIKANRLALLSKDVFIGLCKQHRVAGSNGVAVYKEERKGKHYLYFAYLKDKELLPRDTNIYGVIEAENLADDVNNLFVESNLIILT